LRALRAQEYLGELTSTPPLPTAEERIRLAAILLRTPGGGDADAA
jgi:hypothetical protein